MRIDLLLAAEEEFNERYPGGFLNPEMEDIKKKHKPEHHWRRVFKDTKKLVLYIEENCSAKAELESTEVTDAIEAIRNLEMYVNTINGG